MSWTSDIYKNVQPEYKLTILKLNIIAVSCGKVNALEWFHVTNLMLGRFFFKIFLRTT